MGQQDIGIIGLGVMGKSLGWNLARNGFSVAGLDVSVDARTAFENGPAGRHSLCAFTELKAFLVALRTPRVVLIMIPAGEAVDRVIAEAVPLMNPGDVLIDGGNSHYRDTARRYRELEARGIHFVGMGISGGEQGALEGPSLMPGGHPDAWMLIRPIFEKIAARSNDGVPCCVFAGPDGAGHFVKMVHNGIEYADMQLIAEAYALLKDGLNMALDEVGALFEEWNQGPLASYLMEISAAIFHEKDESGIYSLDTILDTAGQKGTGRWATEEALSLNVPVPTLAEAVLARALSSRKEQRVLASAVVPGGETEAVTDSDTLIRAVHDALYASKICAYAQGFDLLKTASDTYDWGIDLSQVASAWRAGCIIRARLLDNMVTAYCADAEIPNLLLSSTFHADLAHALPGWRYAVTTGQQAGIPLPAMASALAYYDGYRCARSSANLVQAQRDYFGAHGVERMNNPATT